MTETFSGVDALMLARIQFAFAVAWHFLFPAFTIGLARNLAVLNTRYLITGGRSFFLRRASSGMRSVFQN